MIGLAPPSLTENMQLAMKMHKQFQEDRYIYWSVISAVLQVGLQPNHAAYILIVRF